LFPSNFDDQGSLDKTLNMYLTRFGVPPQKINLGTAFYGYEFHAPDINTDVKSDLKTKTRNYGPYTKPRINKNGWERRFDPVAMAPYLVHVGEPVGFITYDDKESTARKVRYALEVRNLGGVFMWELSADFDGKDQDLMDAMYRAFRKAKKDAAH
jgi:GH18 family chitinase